MKPKNNRSDETHPTDNHAQDRDVLSETQIITCKSAAACRRRREIRVANPKFRWRVLTTNWTSRASH
jgi:hypothetical protein